MKPRINVLVREDGVMKAITREMTEEEYAEYMQMQRLAAESEETATT